MCCSVLNNCLPVEQYSEQHIFFVVKEKCLMQKRILKNMLWNGATS